MATAYVPNATDVTQPTEDKFVFSAAEEFRKVKVRLAEVAAAIGTGSAATGGLIIPNFVINQSTPNGRVEFFSTNPLNWASGPSTMHVRFEFVSNNYFAANPNGHVAVVLRQDPATITTAVRGNGMAFGNLSGAVNGTQVNPGAQLESWANGLSSPQGENNLIAGTDLENGAQLMDGMRYRVLVDSVLTQASELRVRLALYMHNPSSGEWDLHLDTGYVVDSNTYFDVTKTGLVFGHVFASNLVAWSLDIQNIQVTWGPAPVEVSANTDRLSKFGGGVLGDMRVTGDVTITGALTVTGGITGGETGGLVEPVILTQPLTLAGIANSIKLNNSPGAFASWGYVQNSVANGNSTLMVKPNGTAVNASFLATNRNDLASAFSYVATGMDGGTAVTETFGVNGGPPPNYSVRIGGVTALAATSNGITVPTLTSAGSVTGQSIVASLYAYTPYLYLNSPAVPLGTQLTDMLTGPNNLGGPNAVYASNSSFNMEQVSTVGGIVSLLATTGGSTEQKIETATRILYAQLSCLLKALHDRNVI